MQEADMFAIIEHMINQTFADEVYKNITDVRSLTPNLIRCPSC